MQTMSPYFPSLNQVKVPYQFSFYAHDRSVICEAYHSFQLIFCSQQNINLISTTTLANFYCLGPQNYISNNTNVTKRQTIVLKDHTIFQQCTYDGHVARTGSSMKRCKTCQIASIHITSWKEQQHVNEVALSKEVKMKNSLKFI